MKNKKGLIKGLRMALVGAVSASLVAGLFLMGGCASGASNENATSGSGDAAPASTPISVVSREDGSGTRGAFVELVGVLDSDKKDATTADAIITNSTSVALTTVAGDPAAIGYVSLGSLNDTVKALDIDGVAATAANVQAGDYPIQRDFNIATKETVSDAAQDFINFIMSKEGQAVIADNKYIMAVNDAAAFKSNNAEGKVVIGGSSSVSPVMEKLIEAYASANSKVQIELQTTDSSVGMSSTIEGVYEIGMASRALKDTELSGGLTPIKIATDGIAVVVNNDNKVSGLSVEQVKQIFLGEVTNWSELS